MHRYEEKNNDAGAAKYLTSRFRITTKQTRELPAILVMVKIDITVAMVTSADWVMI